MNFQIFFKFFFKKVSKYPIKVYGGMGGRMYGCMACPLAVTFFAK